MTKSLLILINTIIVAATVSGQGDISPSNLSRQISIVLGGVHYQARDDIIAPLRWDGSGISTGLSYSLIGDKGLHDIEFRLLYATLSNRYKHINRVAEIKLAYGYMHKIAFNESIGELYLGGLIDWNHNLQYYENWDDSHFYWLNVYELGPVTRWKNTIRDNHQIGVRLNFTLLALASRPPEFRYYDQLKLDEIYSKPHENMKLTSIHEYISFGLRGEYLYRVSSKIRIGGSYLLNYKTYSEPSRIRLFTHTLLLKIQFKGRNNIKEKND